MAFSVVGIQAHFSKTLLLFFMPQIFNFILSCPQLFGLVPCPRHRVPRYVLTRESNYTVNDRELPRFRFDKDANLLYPSLAVPANETDPKKQFPIKTRKLTKLALGILETLGLTKVIRNSNGEITNTTNLTILNVFLLWLGPMNEKRLVQVLITSQVRSHSQSQGVLFWYAEY
jgi:UDP-N-acetylglucosamine--dolichyl-phosphate N-acetylglucosaminephosphotransferase